uniref:Macro domain-containing protein n=1 Tax=Pseudonaja textilis TaxID=8673 RepID=A0A670Y6D3_PSETE
MWGAPPDLELADGWAPVLSRGSAFGLTCAVPTPALPPIPGQITTPIKTFPPALQGTTFHTPHAAAGGSSHSRAAALVTPLAAAPATLRLQATRDWLPDLKAAASHSTMYPENKQKKLWWEEKERLLKMTLEERCKEYLWDYVPLKDIPTWKEEMKNKAQSDEDNTNDAFLMQKSLSEKVSLYRGDITVLEIDAIVNAANSSLLGGGGMDGCIHRAAGPCLVAESKITCGYDLPAKYVIHTVGPIARGHISNIHKEDLANCYKISLKLAKEKLIRSIAFPCISTGIYDFPNEPAAVIALTTVKEWLRKNENEKIIFSVNLHNQ